MLGTIKGISMCRDCNISRYYRETSKIINLNKINIIILLIDFIINTENIKLSNLNINLN